MEENKTLNEMNSEQPINTETPVLENPIADMAPVVETPAPEVVAEVAPVVETPAPEVVAEVAPVVETPAPVSAEVAPVVETPAPVSAEVAPVVETPAPVSAEVVPATETPAAGTTPAEGTAAPVTEEKKKAPVNIVAVLIIVVCCVLGGYIIWSRSKPEPTPNPTPTPNPAPVVTPSDEPNTPDVETDPLNHPVAAAEKYTFAVDGTEYTVYLKTGTNNFYYLTNAGCVSGNYGTYTEVDGTLTLQSEAYYNCESCYYTSADATNGTMATLVMSLSRDAAVNTLANADGTQIFTFAGTEEIGNPFNLEGVHSCDNLENAN